MNDKALITRVLVNDDQHAFTTLVRNYQQPIRQFLCRLTQGYWPLADDIAQQVFIKLYANLATFRAESSLSTWLHSVAYRTFLNEVRKPHHLKETELDGFEQNNIAANNVDNEILVEQLMAMLPISERACLTLAFSAGMSHKEIATVTDYPLGTVKSHISRAKQKLSTWLEETQARNET